MRLIPVRHMAPGPKAAPERRAAANALSGCISQSAAAGNRHFAGRHRLSSPVTIHVEPKIFPSRKLRDSRPARSAINFPNPGAANGRT
jgi:hypothetical protein